MQAGSTTAFTWQEIEQDWLGGSSGLAAAADDVVVAFNTVAAYFGRDWVEASRARSGGPTRGMWPTLHIVALGRRFAALDGIPNSQVLLDKLRRHQPDAIAEFTLFEPVIQRGRGDRARDPRRSAQSKARLSRHGDGPAMDVRGGH
jgi:hypothetical protein